MRRDDHIRNAADSFDFPGVHKVQSLQLLYDRTKELDFSAAKWGSSPLFNLTQDE